jgi:hypothetical protein
VNEGSVPQRTRIRSKLEFLEAEDPAKALLEFFGSLGTQPRAACQEGGVESVPLILISQLPRSGGSLLSQLLDGHPQLLAYPWEMKIGYSLKIKWPNLDLRQPPDRLFAALFHPELVYMAKKGYRKGGKAKSSQKRLKFDYSAVEHYQDFVRLLPRGATQRAVLDTRFSTFFQAWQPETAHAAYISAFVPKMATQESSIANFFEDYPDGRLISILRDPADWFVSRRAHTQDGQVRYDDVDKEMGFWNRMAENALHLHRTYGDQFLLLSFKELVTDRERTMRRVCDWCSIDFNPCLLQQTFGGSPISPNTNFDDPLERLAEAVLDRKLRLTERGAPARLRADRRPREGHCGTSGGSPDSRASHLVGRSSGAKPRSRAYRCAWRVNSP